MELGNSIKHPVDKSLNQFVIKPVSQFIYHSVLNYSINMVYDLAYAPMQWMFRRSLELKDN